MIYRGHQIMETCQVFPTVGKDYFVIRNEETRKWVSRKGKKQGRFATLNSAKRHIDKILTEGGAP